MAKKDDTFTLKQVGFGTNQNLLIGMADSGIVKITYTAEHVTIAIWDANSENIVHSVTYRHEDLVK